MASAEGGTTRSGQLREILDFAILKEQEAADFYADLAGKMKESALAGELHKIVAMELMHRQRLERLDLATATRSAVPRTVDLKISDYVVEKEPSPGMTWQEILTIAMHRELAAMRLYTDLGRLAEDPLARQLFENLAAEEANHKLFFERIWDDEVLREN